MILKWVNQSRDSWNACVERGEFVRVIVTKRLKSNETMSFGVYPDGGVSFYTSSLVSGRELSEMNAAIGEARAYLNQPVRERGD